MKLSTIIFKLIIIVGCLLIGNCATFAQVTIKGKVQDRQGAALPFSNVVLLSAIDSSLVTGTISDDQGIFSFDKIKPSHYLINTLMIGYQSVITPFHIEEEQTSASFIHITMLEDTTELDEVVIKAQKPLFEKQIDRTVVNVQSSITSTGKSALEILAKSPGVLVNRQNNTLSMYGKNGVSVMINGKMSRQPLEAVVQMLEGMSAANIDKIELITSPPAKYEAAGDAGIINIVMVENVDEGTNGSFGLTAGYNQGPTGGGNLNLNHRNKKINFFLDYALLSDKNESPWMQQRTLFGEVEFDRSVVSNQQRRHLLTTQNLRAGIEYTLNEKTSASILITGYRRNWDMDGLTDNVNNVSPDSVINTTMDLYESNIWQSLAGGMGVTHQIDAQQHIGIDIDYLYYVNKNPSHYYNTRESNTGNSEEELVDVTKNTPIHFKVAKIDYANQLSDQLRIEAGLKASFSSFVNAVSVNTLKEDQWIPNDDLSNLSDLDEKIWAAYASYDWKVSDALKIYGGLRYEYTDSYLSTPEEQGLVDREFGNLFPSINFSQKINEKSSINLAYARRITRPTFNDIAPFVYFTGPNAFFAGNPALRPAISDGIDLTYHHNSWWISLKYNDIKNNIGWLQPELNTDTNELVFRSQNMKYFRTWSISYSMPFSITPWWELQQDLSLYYQSYETAHLLPDFSDHAVSVSFNGTSTFTLPKDFAIELSGNFLSKQFWGVWEFEPMGQLDIGFKKKLKNNNGTLTLSFTDIFHTMVWKDEVVFPNGEAKISEIYDINAQSVNLTYVRTFGNKKLKSVNLKSASEEERKRIQ